MRDDRVRLGDILEAIERIEKHIGQGRDAFSGDELVQTWVVHHLMIIGEACRSLSVGFRAALVEVEQRQVVAEVSGMRVVGPKHFLLDRENPLVQRFGLAVAALVIVQPREIC